MPEIVLLLVFAASLLIFKKIRGRFELAFSARIAMAAMLLVTGIAHFAFAKGMAMMLPDIIPQKELVVYLTGMLEIAAAAGLLIPRFSRPTGWLLIVFFVLILPANVYAALHHVDLEKANYEGSGPGYLWFRIPLQLFFIAWVYWSAVRNASTRLSPHPVSDVILD